MQQGFQLRDVFNPTMVDQLAHNIARTWPTFDQVGFSTTINTQLGSLSFGARNTLIRDTLWAYLPKDFPQAVQILVDSLGPEIPHCEVTGFDGFIVMPQNDFVAKYGLDYFNISMRALYEMTKRFTAEGAIRAFIQTYPDQTLAVLRQWAEDLVFHLEMHAVFLSTLAWFTRDCCGACQMTQPYARSVFALQSPCHRTCQT